jgi:hypothetical protein
MSVALFPPTRLKSENLANACCKGMVTLTIKIFFIKTGKNPTDPVDPDLVSFGFGSYPR